MSMYCSAAWLQDGSITFGFSPVLIQTLARDKDNMRGLVNYNIREDEDNYKVIINADGVKGNNITKSGNKKYSLDLQEVKLHDPIFLEEELNFSSCGLAFANHPTSAEKIFANYPISKEKLDAEQDSQTKEVYERELVELLKSKNDNIEDVVGFYHSMRSDLNPTSSPVFHVHGDYTATSAKNRMRFLLKEKAEDWLGEDVHWGIVNTWRPIENPVEKSPLGFVDPSTLSSEDLLTVSYIYPDEGKADEYQHSEHPALVHNESHRWLVLDKMEPSMVWIFNQYDTRGLITVPHSAVEIVGTREDARPRRSIESKMLVKYKD